MKKRPVTLRVPDFIRPPFPDSDGHPDGLLCCLACMPE